MVMGAEVLASVLNQLKLNNMKTIETTTAKNFNLYTKEELPSVYTQKQNLNGTIFDYSEMVSGAKLDLPDEKLKAFNPVLLFEAREQKRNFETELYYIEHVYTCFYSPKGNICLLRFNRAKNKYFFMPYYGYYRQVQNIEHYKREEIKKHLGIELSEPQNIGVFTDKKINEWLSYCDLEIEANDKILAFSESKNEQIKREIADFCTKSGGDVAQYGETTQVITKNFRVIFTHNQGSQYLSKKIEFLGGLDDVLSLQGAVS